MSRQTVVIGIGSALSLVFGIIIGVQWSGATDGRFAAAIETQDRLRAGPFQVAVVVVPEVPMIGNNTVMVSVADAAGTPVDGALVAITAIMRAMGAMPEMRVPAEMAQTGPGQYEGTFSLSMDGSWPLTVRIEKAGVGTATLVFDMATRRRGLELVSGALDPSGRATQQADAELPPGTIGVDARRRQAIGVKIGMVETMVMRRRIRAVGRVTYDETRLSDVSLRFDAWIGQLTADHVGVEVTQNETLFTVYGPELLAAQQAYLEVVRRLGSGSVVEAARKRLEIWNLTDSEINALVERGTPAVYVAMVAPRSGIVVQTNIVEGTAHRAGMTLMRIADLSRVWVEAQIYEADLATITSGMPVTVTLPYLPGEHFDGRIDYIYPYLDEASRTVRIRVPLENPDGVLKPGMYAEVVLDVNLGERLVVPVEAVIFAGESRIVFEDLGDGLLAPRRIQTGLQNTDYIEVLEGLEAGARIVTSGTFLIASESRLSSGLDQW